MTELERTYKDIVSDNVCSKRCKECRYFVSVNKQISFCNLIYPNIIDCKVLQEELSLKGQTNECHTNA